MQGNAPWYQPPQSALNSETANSNYFYNYNHHHNWNRPPGGYDSQFYAGNASSSNHSNNYPMSTMRTCGDSYAATPANAYSSSYECQSTYYRQHGSMDYGGPCSYVGRSRQERGRAANSVPDAANQQGSFDPRVRNPKPVGNAALRANDAGDDENFSSVFTQSLTSLYSQDVDGNFVDEKNCEEVTPSTSSARVKTEDVPPNHHSNPPTNPGYEGFPPVYDVSDATNGVTDFENVKIKTEPFTPPETSQYDTYSMDDMYLNRRGTLAEAYNRKRKHSMPSMYGSSSMNSNDGSNNSCVPKPCKVFQPDSQWIPNSLQNCQGDMNMADKCGYRGDFPTDFDRTTFDKRRFPKKQPVKPRACRRKTELSEIRSACAVKKFLPKKVSPLTVYVKIHDDVILDVTCRRYKKRSNKAEEAAAAAAAVQNFKSQDSYDSWRNIYEVVGKVLHSVVERVTRSFNVSEVTKTDLSRIPPAKGSELLYKFCHDYGLDYRDFSDFYEIIETDVTKDYSSDKRRSRKEKRTDVRDISIPRERHSPRSKRRRTATNDESVCRRSERVADKEPKEPKIDRLPENEIIAAETPRTTRSGSKPRLVKSPATPESPRVLRSLPSRQPSRSSRSSRKPRRQNQKNRYPRRNLRTKNTGSKPRKKLKILIDLSKENDQAEVLEVDSDSSVDRSNVECVEKQEDDDNEDDTRSKATAKSSGESESEEDEDSSNHGSAAACNSSVVLNPTKELKVSLVPLRDPHRTEEIQSSSSPGSQADGETEDAPQVKEEHDVNDDDVNMMQPPQLVRMTDSNAEFPEDNHGSRGKEICRDFGDEPEPPEEGSGDAKNSENAAPPTLSRSADSPPSSPCERFPCCKEEPASELPKPGENAGQDEPELPNDESSQKPDAPEEVPESSPQDLHGEEQTNDKSEQRNVIGRKNIDTSTESGSNDDGGQDENSADECVVVHSSIEKAPVSKAEPPTPPPSRGREPCSKEPQENLPEAKTNATEVANPEDKRPSSGSKNSGSKDEQDESILRTLLLESEVATGATLPKDIEAADPSCLSKILGISSREHQPLNLDLSKAKELSSCPLPNFANDAHLDLCETLKIPKYQSYYDAYIRSLSPETYEVAQKQFKDNPAHSIHQITKCEAKEVGGKDPKAMREKIGKLKSEIMYLQMMADQKEKEKTAIICFKRYKEEILKRVYKEYALCVQDHVRDWIFAKRENSSESRASSTVSSNASSPTHRSDGARTSDQSKIADGAADDDPYPIPIPAHQSTPNHRTQKLLAPQPLPKQRSSQDSGDKLQVPEKSNESYGLDMSNLRERLRSSPETSTSSGTILQKVLSSKTPSRNSTPDQYAPPPWSPEAAGKRAGISGQPVAPVASKVYPDQYNIPLDMMVNRGSKSSPNTDCRSPKMPEHYRGGMTSSQRQPAAPDRAQVQTVIPDPVNLKTSRNPYRSWSIQTGGRISEDRSVYPKPSASAVSLGRANSPANVVDVESPVQRQLNPHKNIPRQSCSISSPTLKPSPYEPNAAGVRSPNFSDRSSAGSTVSDRGKKPDEERRALTYGSSVSSMSPSSTIPYGGHIIPNSNPLTSPVPSGKTSAPTTSATPLCMGCGVSDAKFLCSGCRKHWYCSPQCQSLRWPEHSRVCTSRMFSQTPSTFS